ncbi:hypothetical protein [Streptomyces triticiradicis]|uniref:hypothetical protein n=1 Tax=Streptomyces triticiradicis TaxID=2651189 RepID=UPI001788C977|nr:hypothetical protein [Streptomyces triticiradicis]
MPSSAAPSTADQQLIDHAAGHGLTVTAKQLAGWRRAGLLLGNIPGGGLGRGRGSTSAPLPESFDLVVALARLAGRGKRPADLALLLFADALPVPQATVRAAFRAAVDAVTLPDDSAHMDDGLDLDERLDHLSHWLHDSGQSMILVPARARRIDERIAQALGDLPVELAELDANTEPPRLTPQDASLTAVTAVLGGSISVQDIGALLRAMNPGMTAHPIASLVETTQQDVPEAAATMLADDGSLTLIPGGDVRDLLRNIADTAPLDALAAGWRTALEVREWALGLCARVEGELEAGRPGEAVTEWLHGRQLMSGLSVIETLCERRWSPSKGALSALTLLFMRERFTVADALVPGCQWEVLEMPGVLPPPVRDLLVNHIVRSEAASLPKAKTTERPRPL